MRRIILMLTATALIAAMLAFGSGGAASGQEGKAKEEAPPFTVDEPEFGVEEDIEDGDPGRSEEGVELCDLIRTMDPELSAILDAMGDHCGQEVVEG